MKTLRITTLFLSFLASGLALPSAHAQIDLHTHLDMHPGMGPFLRGNFFEPARATQWNSRLLTKGSSFSLTPLTSPRLMVVSLYAHPLLSYFGNKEASLLHFDATANMQVALDQEYENIVAFVREHADRFSIARNATEAEAILKQKKNVIVFSIEGAAGAFENEGDLKKWIDERGIAIVTPFHLTEDHFSGPALMPNSIAYFNAPLDFIRSILVTGGECLHSFCRSTMGIKPDGESLIENLMKRKVWIDLAHANEISVRELLPSFQKLHLPLLVSHTQFRDFFPAERGISSLELNYLKKEDGIIGLIPTQDMIRDLPTTLSVARCTDGTDSGLEVFRSILQEAFQKLGAERVALGSDTNAPLTGLSPVCHSNNSAVSDLEQKGYYQYSQWNALSEYVAASPQWNEAVLQHFLKEWKRIRP